MVEIQLAYEGNLRCRAIHGPSGMVLQTDAPKDNMGRGEAFSPTDLVATALGTCMLTIMGIVAQRHGVDASGTTARVTKEMVSEPHRRIGRLGVEIHIPHNLPAEMRERLERAMHACPVGQSLHPEVEVALSIKWG